MNVCHPDSITRTLDLFYPLIDFLIRLIKEEKIKVCRSQHNSQQSYSSFEISLVESKKLEESLVIQFTYEP